MWQINNYELEITYIMGDGGAAPAPYSGGYDFGEPYSVTSPTVAGYTPDIATVIGTMPAHDVDVTVTYTANTDTAYKVEHYTQNLDLASFSLQDTDNLTGTTNTLATASLNSYTGFSAPGVAPSEIIAGDGSTVIRVEYTRNSYTIDRKSVV